ncbi:MAG: hypothetical protein MUD14_17950 [Hydrococcus sp. Prado102]|nr:hypothetical protein [Hydrococcus sp. Prado102]
MKPIADTDKICAELERLDRVDTVTGAVYRKQAQDILADTSIALKIRQAIADRLFQANRRLGTTTTGNEDSY